MKHVEMQREELEAQITLHILQEKETAPTRQPSTVRATTPIYTRCIK